jgi:hypothetical protein
MKADRELEPWYSLSPQEWDGLDSTAKDRLASLSLATIGRWQKWKKERREVTFAAKLSSNTDKKRAVSAFEEFQRDWKNGVYDSKLESVVESLNIHYEELWDICHVGGKGLVSVIAKRYSLTHDECADMLSKILPIYNPDKPKT